MENWYAILEIEKARQSEIKAQIRNNYLIQSARKTRPGRIRSGAGRAIVSLGKSLETFGRMLQKKSQTC